MAITSAICTSFKQELLVGTHNFATGGDTFKLALYTSSATLGAATTAYATTGEASARINEIRRGRIVWAGRQARIHGAAWQVSHLDRAAEGSGYC
jgi:hypothetical protein